MRLECAIAICLAIDDFAIVADEQDCSGDLLRGDGLLDDGVEGLQAGVVLGVRGNSESKGGDEEQEEKETTLWYQGCVLMDKKVRREYH